MNNQLSNWESGVQQGLFAEETFTNGMKQTVLDAVERKPDYSSKQWKPMIGALVMCVIVGFLLVNGVSDQKAPFHNDSVVSGSGNAVIFQALDAREWVRGDVIREDDPNILPGLSNKFNPLNNETNGYIEQIPVSDIELLEEKRIEGFGTALRYELKENSITPHIFTGERRYLGFTTSDSSQSDQVYHYGTPHMYDLDFSMTRLFGHDVLKISQTVCRTDGESCVWYLRKGTDEQMYTYMSLDAVTYEQDLDGDGKEEVIALTHKQNQIYIFKEESGKLSWASVREALRLPTEVTLQYVATSGQFTVGSDEEKALSVYTYQNGQLSLLQ